MMCLYVLMVGATSCLDRDVHTIHVADALPTSCPCVDTFRVDLRVSVEQRVRRKCLMNDVDLVQLGGHVPNPKDPYTAVRRRGCKTRYVRQNRLATVSGSGEQNWKSRGDLSLWRWSCRTRHHNLFWRMLQIWLGTSIVIVDECF